MNVPVPRPKHGSPFYWCPRCPRGHCRNSTLGHLHKVYIDIDRGNRPPDPARAG